MNYELLTLIKGNHLTPAQLHKLYSVTGGKVRRYHVSEAKKNKYKLLVRLGKLGLTIPYHHRPKCRECGSRYQPTEIRQYTCQQCGDREGYDLTPTDLKELGYSPEAAARVLGLPPYKRVYKLLRQWNEEEEDAYVIKLKHILRERGK